MQSVFLPPLDRAARRERAAVFPGLALRHPLVEAAWIRSEVRVRFQYAADLARAGRPGDAIGEYIELLKVNPDFAEAHNNLGLALLHQGKPDEAARHFERALEIDPAFEPARGNLRRLEK